MSVPKRFTVSRGIVRRAIASPDATVFCNAEVRVRYAALGDAEGGRIIEIVTLDADLIEALSESIR